MLEIILTDIEFNNFKSISKSCLPLDMQGVSIIEEQSLIKNAAASIIDVTCYHYGNIFSHNEPFAMHSDISDKKKSILLIPITAHTDQKFVVFDQTINQDSPISWIYNIFDDKTDEELKAMYYQSSHRSRPCDTQNVKGITAKPIDDELYQHLPFSKDFYFGMTGVAWDYTPGRALLFDANRIHATGKMQSSKIGCTIQFTDSIDNLRMSLKERILS